MNARFNFWFNKYLSTPVSSRRYYLSFDSEHKALWFRMAKVASRTIDQHLREGCRPGGYWYGSRVGYAPSFYKDWYKFAFVRHPVDRLLSAWRDKVCDRNMFGFSESELHRMRSLEHFLGWLEKQDVENCDEHLMAQHRLVDLDRMDMIGKFERFDQDFAIVARKLGIAYQEGVRLNSSVPRDVQLTDPLRDRIQAIYRTDMDLFYS